MQSAHPRGMIGTVSLAEEKGASRPEDRLLELIDEQVPPERAQAVRGFARSYLRRLGGGGTEGLEPEALLGEVNSLFEFACSRDGEVLAVRASSRITPACSRAKSRSSAVLPLPGLPWTQIAASGPASVSSSR